MVADIQSPEGAKPVEKKAAQSAPSAGAEGPFIRYNGAAKGIASERTISAAEWGSIGIKAKPVAWNWKNEFRLPASQFDDDQLDYLLDKDGRFDLVNKDGEVVSR